jgi:hypothetical protein
MPTQRIPSEMQTREYVWECCLVGKNGVLEKGGQVTDLPLRHTIFRRGGSVTHPLARIGDSA